MKKWEKYYISITGVIFIITCIISIIFLRNVSHLSEVTVVIIKMILCLILLLIEVAMVVYFSILGIITMKRGMHNIKKCDDELFTKIDQYKKCWGEDNNYYIKQIEIINLLYKKDVKVDELVKNKEIERLYARADFLFVQNSLYDNLTTCFSSLVISVIASFVCQMMQCKRVILMFVWMITILICFFGIVLSRYAKKGHDGSYRYYIDEYERKLLMDKIRDLENELIITDQDEQILETKQVVINKLIEIRQKKKLKKQKEKLETDIKQVGQLNLCMGDYTTYYIQKINIKGVSGCLVYDLEKGKENNYMGELNLINEDYSILYQILNRYDLISYYEREK